ncbi:hypothetical protein PV963_22685 [Streptomyces coeruleorubidus]|jgi:hypothetical protein|uniref:hypothetical protein n=1 Tax=Streptomyces coeruleorubidus TaxID=116188 RepID=UPI00237F1C37|nr:hypothetical protein [Streptomyces coeruleorubidus]WDV52967.1 hypothetical protein PV963_22685 [Streptomyces coeruleorubidus]
MVATASPASADGTWAYYGTKNPITSSASTWRCGPTESVNALDDVYAQVCAVRTVERDGAQAAVIIRNNSNKIQSAKASMSLWNAADNSQAGWWGCGSTGLTPNAWTVCFGNTLNPKFATVYADGAVNGSDFLVRSPNV